ncbi:leucine-rich repeat protein [Lysinibacillus sp. LZ02]|uniref:leucine-rich repeat protein n=1 Tax=Lysinibacillus sp. LZ02 TaxID=3420668 RepID=UPI003D36EB13
MKKLSSLFLIVLLLNLQWGNIPVYGVANSETDFEISENATEVTITGYKGTTKDVKIPPTINGKAVTSIGEEAFLSNELASVTIPSSVTSIGDSAFSSNQLASVTIPSSVTSIGAFAFYNNKLASVTIPSSVTSIGDYAFQYNQLASVTIPSSVTSIGDYAFQYNQLASVTIPSSVTSIGASAFEVNQLASVTIPSSVTSIGANAFLSNQLASVTIPSSVTSIENGAFASNQLASVTIPSSVTSIGASAFSSNQLASVTIPSSVTSIGAFAFQYNQLNQVEFKGQISNLSQKAFSNQTKQGDKFHGWFEDPSYTNPWTGMVAAPMIIYAKWNTYSTGIILSPKTSQLTVGGTQNFQLVENLSDGTSQDQTTNTAFTVSDPAIATMQGNKLTAIAPGTVTVTATYGATADTATITVKAAPVTTTGIILSPKTGQLTVGGTQNFQLTENLSDGTTQDQTVNTVFTVSDSTVATIQGSTLTAIAPGTVTVTATYGATADTATITVNAAPVTTTGIILSPKTGQLTVGGTQNFQLTENLSDGTTQDQTVNTVFTVSDSTVATIQGSTLTAIAPGTVTVTATYGTSTDTATITVKAPTPIPIPEPDDSVEPEPMPSGVIPIIRTVEQGIVRYRANVLLEPVQVQVHQMTNQEERTIRLVYPAETAMVEAILNLSRTAGLYLNNQQTHLFMQTALAQLTMPSTAFNGITEDVFFRIVPVKAQQQEMIQTNVRQNQQIQQVMPERAILSSLGTPVTIETNLQSRPITITLPISAELTAEQMASLVVYIEHSDATTEVKRGRIVEFEPGAKGFQFEVEHFSTFSLVYASEVPEVEPEVKPEVKVLAPYIQGYPDGTFKPNASVTRAQMATMLARFLTNGDIPTTVHGSFEDTTNHPSRNAIELVKQAGLFNGTTETIFNPNGTITRAQMARVIARWIDKNCVQDDAKAYCQEAGQGKTFTDVHSTHWAAQAIDKISALGIMSGNSATTFNPNGALTRAQAVKVLNQLFERPALEDIATPTFSDVPSTHWAIEEIEAAATEIMVKK